MTPTNTKNDISDNEIRIISLKLDAAKTLISHERHEGATKVAVKFMKQLIGAKHSEPVNNGMLFGEVLALISEDSETLVSRKSYDIDYIFYNSETSQFMSYKNGKAEIHSFESKDYIANDWYVVNNGDK